MQLVPGERFGQYVIEAELGRGGQAVVYRARQAGTDRDVALKVFAEREDDGKLERFRREAVAAARVDDPRIVTVFDSGDVDGVPFIAMRLVPGPSLAELVARFGPLPPTRALFILEDVASAVDAAHAHGLIHRDIKPANVLLDLDDRAYLSDFGVARLEDLPGLTRRGDWLGTVEYVSPEQAAGHPATAASDIYAFGVLAFELLCGRPPFVHRQASAVLVAHVRDEPPAVRDINPALPEGVDAALAAALAKSPERRPRTACDLVGALRAALEDWPDPDADAAMTVISGPSWTRGLGTQRADALTGVAATRVATRPGLLEAELSGGATLVTGLADPAWDAGPGLPTRVVAADAMDSAPAPAAGRTPRRRRAAVAVACAVLVAAGAAAGWAVGDRQTTAARADGYHSGYAHGVAAAERVPDAKPGQYRVVWVDSSGHAKYVGAPFNSGDCVKAGGNGSVDNISNSWFSPCGLFSGV